MSSDSSRPTPSSIANALAHEKSPYLLQHAHNPVSWLPWGESAFARAREENKPIFLSVGYSTCHWCHVMAHESFEDTETAQILNESFISIKVDREERPDIDRLYMTFVQATTGQGGWPMSVWLTPELKPFVGGTYFPPDDVPGRVGFRTLLQRIAKAWEANRDGVMIQGSNMLEALRQNTNTEPVAADAALPGQKALDRGLQIFSQMFDTVEGGWGQSPKFPRPSVFAFLLREYARRGAHTPEGRQAAEMVLFTLGKMATGGIHDVLGGGFHRYSVDGQWHVPHFEKMLYDQAQLVVAYLEAAQVSGESAYADVARDILDYVQRDMTDALGGFYSAEDADSLLKFGEPQHAEGAFYVWTQEEIEAVLGADESPLFCFAYEVKPAGNVAPEADPHGEFPGKNILIQRHTLEAIAKEFAISTDEATARLKQSREKLFAARTQRPRPHLDDKILTAWNGLMISAFARAFQVLGEASYLTSAQKAAAFVREHLTHGQHDQLLRSYRQGPGSIAGFADDYAAMIQGLLDLYEADFDSTWLNWAIALQERMDEQFWDAANGGYFSTSGADATVLLRLKEDYDGAEPSPNSVAALNLQRLSAITGRAEWQNRAQQLLRAYSALLTQSPVMLPQMLTSLDFTLGQVTQIILRAPADDDTALLPLLREVHGKFLPRKVLIHSRDTATMAQAQLVDGQATAYVCIDFTCQLPTNRPETLRQQLFHIH